MFLRLINITVGGILLPISEGLFLQGDRGRFALALVQRVTSPWETICHYFHYVLVVCICQFFTCSGLRKTGGRAHVHLIFTRTHIHVPQLLVYEKESFSSGVVVWVFVIVVSFIFLCVACLFCVLFFVFPASRGLA